MVVKGALGRPMESVMEVTEYERNEALGLRLVSASWGGTGRTRYNLTRGGEGVRERRVGGGVAVELADDIALGWTRRAFDQPFVDHPDRLGTAVLHRQPV